MAGGFNSKGSPAPRRGKPSSIGRLQLEAAETPKQRVLRLLVSAMRRTEALEGLIRSGFSVEGRVIKVLETAGSVGEDHASLIRLMSWSLVSGLLDDEALAQCRSEELFRTWLEGSSSRVAWSVAVGGGKTLCAASLCREVTENLRENSTARGVLYSANSLKLLANMKTAMAGMGVPEDAVGVFHNSPKTETDLRSIEASEIGGYPILLCTQQMLQSASARHEGKRNPSWGGVGTDLDDLLVFRGKDRLTIWDEAFQSSLAESANLSALATGLGSIREHVNRLKPGGVIELQSDVVSTAANTLDKTTGNAVVKLIDELCTRADGIAVKIQGGRSAVVVLPSVDELQREQVAMVGGWLRDQKAAGPAEAMEAISEMLSAGGLDVSLLKAGSKTMAIVRPTVVISDRLKRLVVLDAGYVTSMINGMDPTLKLASGAAYAGWALQPKLFNQVAVHFYCGNSGRGRDGAGLANTKTRLRLIRDQVERIGRVPLGGKSLVITFARKGSGIDFKGEIEAELERSCPGWNDQINGNKRVTVITWGEHVGANDWRDCKHMFFVGVLRRSWAGDLMNEAWATSRGDVEAFELMSSHQVEANQSAQELMQAIGRGFARATINGQAGGMTVHIPYKENHPRYVGMAPCKGSPLWEELSGMLPGCVMCSESQPPKASGAEQVAQAAAMVFNELECDQIASAKLKPLVMAHLHLGGAGVSDDVYKAGLKQLAEANAKRAAAGEACWVKPTPSSRSWVRGAELLTSSPA